MIKEYFKHKLPVTVYLLSFLIPVAFLAFYFSIGNTNIHFFLFNADILYFPSLYKDLFNDNYTLSGWLIPGSPNIFPDMIVYFMLMFISGKATISMFVFAFLQLTAILLLYRFIIRTIYPERSYFVLALGNLLLSLFFQISFVDRGYYLTFLLISNTYHLGSFVNTLIALAFSIAYIKTGRLLNLVFLVIFGILAIISDRLFIVMYYFPFMAALVVFLRNSHNLKKLLFLSLSIGLMLSIGLIVFHRISHSPNIHLAKPYFNVSGEGIASSWNSLYTNLKAYFLNFKIFTLIIILSLLSLGFSLLSIFRSVPTIWKGMQIEDEIGLKQFLNLFFAAFMLVVFFTPVVTGGFQGWDTIRYNIFVFYFGLLYFGVSLVYSFGEKTWIHLTVKFSSIALLVFLLSFGGVYISKNKVIGGLKNYFGYYPEVARCIDYMDEKYPLKQGVSNYWFGKVGTLFSKKDIRLYAVYNESLVPYELVGNENWYYESGYGKYDPPVFNFIILHKPVPDSAILTIEDKLGKIKASEDWGEFLFILVNDFKYIRTDPNPQLISSGITKE